MQLVFRLECSDEKARPSVSSSVGSRDAEGPYTRPVTFHEGRPGGGPQLGAADIRKLTLQI